MCGRSSIQLQKIFFLRSIASVKKLRVGDEPVPLRIPIRNIARLELIIHGSLLGSIGDVWWGDARFVRGNATSNAPQIVTPR